MGPSPNAVFLSDIHQIASGVDTTVAVLSVLSSQITRLHNRQALPSAVDRPRRAERQRFACVGMGERIAKPAAGGPQLAALVQHDEEQPLVISSRTPAAPASTPAL